MSDFLPIRPCKNKKHRDMKVDACPRCLELAVKRAETHADDCCSFWRQADEKTKLAEAVTTAQKQEIIYLRECLSQMISAMGTYLEQLTQKKREETP